MFNKVKIKFFDYGVWSDDPNEPCFRVEPNEVREVTRAFGHYICAVARGELVEEDLENSNDEPLTLQSLALNPVTERILIQNDIDTLPLLQQLTETEILDFKGIGRAKLDEIKAKLEMVGLALAEAP